MFSISQVIHQFKQDWTKQLDDRAIESACRAEGLVWRDRVLPPVYLIKLFLLQILWGNTACDHLPRLADRTFTGEAYCKARGRLPLTVLQRLLSTCTQSMLGATRDSGLWNGLRLWLLDGTAFSMPDTPELQAHFGQPGGQRTGCGFPVAHCLALVHAASGLVQRLIIAPLRTHDLSQVAQVHEHLTSGDLAVGDRGLCSYAHLALLWQRGVVALMRLHQKVIVDFTPRRPHLDPGKQHKSRQRGRPFSRWVRRLGKNDQVVEWFRSKNCPEWMTAEQFAALPASLLVRELRYTVHHRGYRVREVTLVTTLLDAERYPAADLAELYGKRWQIETDFAHLKTTLHMDVRERAPRPFLSR